MHDRHFETGKRDNGETFVRLRDDAPEWLRDAVYGAHQGAMPSDWVYDVCRDALGSIDGETDGAEWADGACDVYTSDLYKWAAEFCNSTLFANAADEAGDICDTGGTIDSRLRTVQYCALMSIFAAMEDAVNNAKDGDE